MLAPPVRPPTALCTVVCAAPAAFPMFAYSPAALLPPHGPYPCRTSRSARPSPPSTWCYRAPPLAPNPALPALGMSSKAFGDRLGMTAQGVRKLEQAEADGSIALKTLARLAEGLDCEVIYVLVPRTSLLEQVLQRAHEVAGGTHEVSPRTRQLSTEPETLEMLATLFAQASRRGFW